MVVDQIPDPKSAQKTRIPGLWRPIRGELSDAQKGKKKIHLTYHMKTNIFFANT